MVEFRGMNLPQVSMEEESMKDLTVVFKCTKTVLLPTRMSINRHLSSFLTGSIFNTCTISSFLNLTRAKYNHLTMLYIRSKSLLLITTSNHIKHLDF